ncbi:hypothetical protein F5Y09DRAFT_315918 [Xylaria sp. FL1042]|nr:hypothetical protein F5Y09DRAFT_315918 [Xylaria sp. FL1042]
MEHECTGSGPTDKGPRGRLAHRDPERRRLQNQRAQKKYRDKRRQRIIDLENLATSIASGTVEVSSPTQGVRSQESDIAVDANDAYNPAFASMQTSQGACEAVDQLSHFRANDNLVIHTGNSTSSLIPNHLTGNEITSFSSATKWSCDPTNNITYHEVPRPAWTIELVDCGCPVLHIQIRVPSNPDANSLGHLSHRLAFFNFPDPYANALRLERLCTMQALERNCMVIGITIEMCCLDDSVSPFFRRITHNTSGHDNFIRSVQAIFQTLKPDLRPCTRQITIGHHPFIDVLPFPRVRSNLIGSIGIIDEDDFFRDSLNGLICWGGTGVSRRDADGAGTGTGTPWDIRSWEAKQWFIQKWWLILGGEEGELVQQSKWWRALRGEDEEPFMAC